MRHAGIGSFATEFEEPCFIVAPLLDRGIGTAQGEYATDQETLDSFNDFVEGELQPSDELRPFVDLPERHRPSLQFLLDRFVDASDGINPGLPSVIYRQIDPVTDIAEAADLSYEENAVQLGRFYTLTGLQPHELYDEVEDKDVSWGGSSNKLAARVSLPAENPTAWALLHEFGHCGMSKVGFALRATTKLDGGMGHSIRHDWIPVIGGLTYTGSDGLERGTILEEAVAEGVASFVNRRLRLVPTRYSEGGTDMPDMVASYARSTDTPNKNTWSASSPAAIALELIARELGIPPEHYFRMWVDYANVGIQDIAARQEMAETIYKGTRGRLTLAQLEELPYPMTAESSLAILWAVEDAQDVPSRQRYADIFTGRGPRRK